MDHQVDDAVAVAPLVVVPAHDLEEVGVQFDAGAGVEDGAARVADLTAFFSLEVDGARRSGVLVEYDATSKIFTNPSDKRTEDYVTGRFG